MNLVIVESPTKKKTIKKYLGEDFEVKASVGHIRDIAITGKYNLGVDIDSGNFEVVYDFLPGKEKLIEKLKTKANEADIVYLATDPDREGEAISWHLSETLGVDKNKIKRLEFHEITKHAILNSLEQIRDLNEDIIHAQETRRIMDRIIGFRLSYIIKEQVGGFNAGRVQSVVLRFVYENQKAHDEFVPVSTYSVVAKAKDEKGKEISLYLVDKNNEKIIFDNLSDVQNFLGNLGTSFDLVDIKKEEKTTPSFAPYTISKLFQAASSLCHYSTATTTKILKQLFENGYITYPRTDSIRINPEFINLTKQYIADKFGEEYVGKAKVQAHKDNIQDAHEALRPTKLNLDPSEYNKIAADNGSKKIYKLIYDQTIKSMMAAKQEEITTYVFKNNSSTFIFKKSHTLFKGFEIYDNNKTEEFEFNKSIGDSIEAVTNYAEHVSQPEPFFTEGSLVKKMEETGIGRPSTYASTIQSLTTSGYVTLEKDGLHISKIGELVAQYLIKHFPNTIKVEYTANLENELDSIERKEKDKLEVLRMCNSNFEKEFDFMIKNPQKISHEETGELCPVCGAPLVHILRGKADFVGCSNYPTCKYVKPEYTGEKCPECGKPLVYKMGKYGKFISCSDYPSCSYHIFPKIHSRFTKKSSKK